VSYKAVPHLDHADCLEVAVYCKDHPFDKEPISSITVECTKCGEVVEEVYSADDDNTPPLDCEFPEVDRRTWEEGVKDAARIVQNEMRHKKALDHPYAKVPIVVFATLNEVELHLAAMLSRGSYESHDTVMQESLGDVMTDAKGLCIGDPQPVPCPDCGGTGSDCAKYPIVGCATCQGDGQVRWQQNEVQFARLLWEVVAALEESQLKGLIKDLSASMDLTYDQVNELFDRADKVWEKAKAEVK